MATTESYRPAIPPQEASPALRGYLESELNRLADTVERYRRAIELIYITTGFTLGYLWDDTGTTPADPGAGYMRGNAANLNSVTTLWLSKTSAIAGVDVGQIVQAGEAYILDSPDGSNYSYGRIASMTDLGTYWAAALTVTVGKGNPSQADLMALRVIPGLIDL